MALLHFDSKIIDKLLNNIDKLTFMYTYGTIVY